MRGNPVWLSVSAGDETVCGLARDYTLRCWGKNEFGQLGLGDRRNRGSRAEDMENLWPIDLGAVKGIRKVGVATDHTCVLTLDQNVLCWGRNGTGALGLGDDRTRGSSPDVLPRDLPPVDLGRNCAACLTGQACSERAQCASTLCRNGQCVEPSCFDGVRNGGETDSDCGGPSAQCGRCGDGSRCKVDEDCLSRHCGEDGRCVPADCKDGIQNLDETDIDCGDPFDETCPACPDTSLCNLDTDCLSERCLDGVCISCNDGVQNSDETDIDCGGITCGACADGRVCEQAQDCTSSRCETNVCTSCTDGITNGTETDTDCGGDDESCPRCGGGQSCADNTDCTPGTCEANVVTCSDGVQNNGEST